MNIDAILRVLKAPKQQGDKMEGPFLGTGSTLLNLAMSGRTDGGLPSGKYMFFVGDSASGKTFLALTVLAEAQLSKHFGKYRLIFDNAEDGALMDFQRYFGVTVAGKLESPAADAEGNPTPSATVDEFYFNLDDALTKAEKTGQPFIYVLDSMDALSSTYERKKFVEAKTAARKGTKAKGDYGDGKAKTNSRYLRSALARVRDTGSILIVICQTRDNIDAGLFEPSKTRSGGHALQFYATVEVWTSIKGRLKKTVRGKERQVGIIARCAIKKNRVTGKTWAVDIPLYWSSGIDDVGGCVDFLVEESQWSKNKAGQIDGTGDFAECRGYREQVIQFIEQDGLEDDVRDLVADVWADIEKSCTIERKQRYQ